MVLPLYLAITAAEMTGSHPLPPNFAYMACHFSQNTQGLSNYPKWLPDHSILMLDDLNPMDGHDPERIFRELSSLLSGFHIDALVLDFQRPDCQDTATLAALLVQSLPCPVIVSEPYAQGLDCPVLLPPVPPDTPLEGWLSPWRSREIWLETSQDALHLQLTESGCQRNFHPYPEKPEPLFSDESLHCHYQIHTNGDSAEFLLFRTRSDWDALAEKAAALGVTRCLGFWQDFP